MNVSANIKSAESSRTCQILILCEDVAAYERATDVCWRILVQLADDLDFKFNYWNFYELSDPDSLDSVIRTAKWSDIILLSLHQTALSPAADHCLDAIAKKRRLAEGVLALVLSEPPGSPAALSQLVGRLERAAQGMGMDFLSTVRTPVQDTFTRTTSLPASFEGPAGDHWGLNE